MSERGTFVTSFLYDWPSLVPVLREVLPEVCRRGCPLVEHRFEANESEEKTRIFSGLMHGGYPGEEAWDMEQLVFDRLVPTLPEKHGQFSIAVLPESEEHASIFVLLDRNVKILKVRA